MEWQYPVLRHFLVCRRPFPVDAAYREALLRVVFVLRPTVPYPFLLPELHTLVQVSGASGTFAFSVELCRSGEPEVLAGTLDVDFSFPDRSTVFTFLRGFDRLPFREAGLYEFRLFVRMLRDPAGRPVTGGVRRLLATEPLTLEEFS
ncbi:MAG: hypothetical protein C0501_00970 [Isosphaera sp.]|nr:hypothetical protein [Isosphaera sp.]